MKFAILLMAVLATDTQAAVVSPKIEYENYDTFFLPKSERRERREKRAELREKSRKHWEVISNPHSVYGPAQESLFNDRWYYDLNDPSQPQGLAQTYIKYGNEKEEIPASATTGLSKGQQQPANQKDTSAAAQSQDSNQLKLFMYSNALDNVAIDV